jgi:hypothetical protein
MENEVQQALAVMEKDTGWLLNYQQLICNLKYNKAWNLLAANKFGCLAQGVGNRIKGTNTIKFIHKHESTEEQIEGRNKRSACLHQTTQKGGTELNPFHRWMGSNQLPRGGSHTHTRPTCHQNPVQQHNINTWGKTHDNGCLKLLPQLAVSPPGVHLNQNK